jgi:hypothetical protein
MTGDIWAEEGWIDRQIENGTDATLTHYKRKE